jgi:hypothetical protein
MPVSCAGALARKNPINHPQGDLLYLGILIIGDPQPESQASTPEKV